MTLTAHEERLMNDAVYRNAELRTKRNMISIEIKALEEDSEILGVLMQKTEKMREDLRDIYNVCYRIINKQQITISNLLSELDSLFEPFLVNEDKEKKGKQ